MFQPPKTSIWLLLMIEPEWPKRAQGDPLPSGPWNQVMVIGSKAWMSLNTRFFSPFPPKMITREPARIAEWPYRAFGGIPKICGFFG